MPPRRPDPRSPLADAEFRRRRLAWIGLRVGVTVMIFAAFVLPPVLHIGSPWDAVLVLGALFGGPFVVLATMWWVRPRVYACPRCHAPVAGGPASGIDTRDASGRAPMGARGAVRDTARVFNVGVLLGAWLFEAVIYVPPACTECKVWFRKPPPRDRR